jgi:hypothetical protein
VRARRPGFSSIFLLAFLNQSRLFSRSRSGAVSDAADSNSALRLNSDWALHPALRDTLYPLYQKGQLAFIPFAGTADLTRSHFETQDSVEGGMPVVAAGARETLSPKARTRKLTIVAQDPAVTRADGRILTAVVDVPLGTAETPFDRYGDWVPAACIIAVALAGMIVIDRMKLFAWTWYVITGTAICMLVGYAVNLFAECIHKARRERDTKIQENVLKLIFVHDDLFLNVSRLIVHNPIHHKKHLQSRLKKYLFLVLLQEWRIPKKAI